MRCRLGSGSGLSNASEGSTSRHGRRRIARSSWGEAASARRGRGCSPPARSRAAPRPDSASRAGAQCANRPSRIARLLVAPDVLERGDADDHVVAGLGREVEDVHVAHAGRALVLSSPRARRSPSGRARCPPRGSASPCRCSTSRWATGISTARSADPGQPVQPARERVALSAQLRTLPRRPGQPRAPGRHPAGNSARALLARVRAQPLGEPGLCIRLHVRRQAARRAR